MPYRLAPHVYVAFVDDQAIVLDVDCDRYTLLKCRTARALRDWIDDPASAENAGQLGALGLIEPGLKTATLVSLPPVTRSALELDRRDRRDPRFHLATAMLTQSLLGLRCGRLASILDAARNRGVSKATDPDELIGFAQTFARHRSHLPLHHTCLAESLALHRFFSKRGLHASLVIGVRLNPFAAHCWLQSEDLVLNDTCDGVSRFMPIMIL